MNDVEIAHKSEYSKKEALKTNSVRKNKCNNNNKSQFQVEQSRNSGNSTTLKTQANTNENHEVCDLTTASIRKSYQDPLIALQMGPPNAQRSGHPLHRG